MKSPQPPLRKGVQGNRDQKQNEIPPAPFEKREKIPGICGDRPLCLYISHIVNKINTIFDDNGYRSGEKRKILYLNVLFESQYRYSPKKNKGYLIIFNNKNHLTVFIKFYTFQL